MLMMPGRESTKFKRKTAVDGVGGGMVETVPHGGPKKPEWAGLGCSLLPLPQPLAELQEEIKGALQSR